MILWWIATPLWGRFFRGFRRWSSRTWRTAASAQVLAVGVYGGGPEGGGDAQGLGFGHAGVAFGGVQCLFEAAGAVEQADALAEEIVDLVPAFGCGLLAYSAGAERSGAGRGRAGQGGAGRGGAGRVDGGPASVVGADLELDFVAETSPEVPSVADLHCVGQGSAAGLGIRDDRGVAVAAAQGEIVHADQPRDGLLRQRQAPRMAQRVLRETARPRPGSGPSPPPRRRAEEPAVPVTHLLEEIRELGCTGKRQPAGPLPQPGPRRRRPPRHHPTSRQPRPEWSTGQIFGSRC